MTTTLTTAVGPMNLLRIADLDRGNLIHLLDLARRMKGDQAAWTHRHPGETVACHFARPSSRTHLSFEAAAQRLGMLPVMLRPDELRLGRGELIEDAARVLSSYCAAIVVRTFAQAEVEAVAAAAAVPVINALTDAHHPCQALADLLTLREVHGALNGLRLAYVGEGNNVAHSLLEAGALAGMRVTVACPPGYEPSPEVVERARSMTADPLAIEVTHDPFAAVRDADAVYTGVWVSMGEQAEQAQRRRELEAYRVTPALMSAADSRAVFMHCLPAHRGQEVDAAVIDGPRSIVFDQAANRLPTEQALLHTLVTGNWGRR